MTEVGLTIAVWNSVISIFFFSILASAQAPMIYQQGAYLVRAAECASCHSENHQQPFAGGYRLSTPYGTFYTPNITPSRQTGIGSWNFQQFRKALRQGISPSGKIYYPSFPYRSYSKITDFDLQKMFYYLRTVRPIDKPNRPHQLIFPFDERWLLTIWKELYFHRPSPDPEENMKIGVGPFIPAPGRSSVWNRGAYLTEAVLHCAECHTPRNLLGAPISSQWFAGSSIPIDGKYPPNITPDELSGITWNRNDWISFLGSGIDPNHETPGGEMALVVRATSQLTKEDREAVVEYIISQKPVRRFNEDR